MTGVTMVGDFSSGAFARDELLARRLVGCAVLGSMAPVGVVSLSRRRWYQLDDSGTGVRQAGTLEVVKAAPINVGQGIFKCALYKQDVIIKGEGGHPAEVKCAPVCKSMVVEGESDP